MVFLLVRHPPMNGAVVSETTGKPGWTLTDHLIDDLRRTIEKVNGAKDSQAHPLRPTGAGKTADPKKVAGAKRRAAARRRAIEAGEIT